MKPEKPTDASDLRRRAQARLQSQTPPPKVPGSVDEMQRLLQELETHQIELEMQNEELGESQARLEASTARYTDLYDFAPVGYFTLGHQGKIIQSNLAGARLLGLERSRLLNYRFDAFVASDDRPSFGTLLTRIFATQSPETIEVRLAIGDKPPLTVLLQACVSADGRESRLALTDITERKQVEVVLKSRLRLSEYALGHSLDELLTRTLDEAEMLTGSTIGFFHFVEAGQKTLSLQAWSTNTLRNTCSAEGKGRHYDVDKAGVWADALREHRPMIHNDYASLPQRKGMPPGHAPVLRELVVPILRNQQVVAMLGVGNKPGE